MPFAALAEEMGQMDATRFDRLARLFSNARSRRQAVLALLFGGAITLPGLAEAKKKHKQKKKIKRNDFGCVNVGGFCKNSGQCCSGICQGKKGKKKCQAHDTGNCQAGSDTCLGTHVICTTSNGNLAGACYTTTGNAGFCAAAAGCFLCQKDADCQPFCGPAAACVLCVDECADFGGTGCFGPEQCTFPP
jgi:hypothetical protein